MKLEIVPPDAPQQCPKCGTDLIYKAEISSSCFFTRTTQIWSIYDEDEVYLAHCPKCQRHCIGATVKELIRDIQKYEPNKTNTQAD